MSFMADLFLAQCLCHQDPVTRTHPSWNKCAPLPEASQDLYLLMATFSSPLVTLICTVTSGGILAHVSLAEDLSRRLLTRVLFNRL